MLIYWRVFFIFFFQIDFLKPSDDLFHTSCWETFSNHGAFIFLWNQTLVSLSLYKYNQMMYHAYKYYIHTRLDVYDSQQWESIGT